jgi:RNA polymerase sigma-70 factor (ECF subfamily)
MYPPFDFRRPSVAVDEQVRDDLRGLLSSDALGRTLRLPSVAERRTVRATDTALPGIATAAPDDEHLMVCIRAGDLEPLGILFDKYARLVRTIGFRILRNSTEVEDVVQEVFLHIYEKSEGFDPNRGSVRTWLIQIAYHRAFDRRAYLARRGFYDGTDISELKNTLREASSLEDEIAARVTGEQLHAAFAQLNDMQRVTLEKFYFEGYSLREISEMLGETFENTRHHYYRGMERLKKIANNMTVGSEK